VASHYSDRAICEIVWLVASEHFYNLTNIGLNIHSDMLCEVGKERKKARIAKRPQPGQGEHVT
jgi:hypothetical protein